MKVRICTMACSAIALAALGLSEPAVAKQPSVFVQCDGNPAHMSDGERAARILALSAVVGLLIPGPEQPDSNERLVGNAGVAACSAALQSESDLVRRIELSVARAIHQIEAGSAAAAVVDAEAAMELARPLMTDSYFTRSLGLSVMEVNAGALLKSGRFSEAEAMGYRLADAAPYDVINQMRAWNYLGITLDRDPQFLRFLERLSRLWNGAIKNRAGQLEWQGKFSEANTVYAALLSVYHNDGLKVPNNDVSGFWKARQAVAQILAGDRANADALIVEARSLNERLASRGAFGSATGVGLTDELIDFHKVVSLMVDGNLTEARQRFRQRTRWLAPTTGALTLIVDKLRDGATRTELDGPLARPGSEIRNEIILKARLTQQENGKLPAVLFRNMRSVMKAGDFRPGIRSIWKVSKSNYLVEKKGDLAKVPYEVINAYDIGGHPQGYAVLMHASLLARKRGKQGFVIVGDRKAADTIAVLFGNAGDPGTPRELLIEASPLIEALRPDFPEPQKSN